MEIKLDENSMVVETNENGRKIITDFDGTNIVISAPSDNGKRTDVQKLFVATEDLSKYIAGYLKIRLKEVVKNDFQLDFSNDNFGYYFNIQKTPCNEVGLWIGFDFGKTGNIKDDNESKFYFGVNKRNFTNNPHIVTTTLNKKYTFSKTQRKEKTYWWYCSIDIKLVDDKWELQKVVSDLTESVLKELKI